MTVLLPSFQQPPVVEVVCGVQFEPLNLLAAHLGRYSPEGFTPTQEVPPLPPVFESFSAAVFPFRFAQVTAMPRVWYEAQPRDRLIQVQADRFLLNWRKTEQNHPYPRFSVVNREFREQLAAFGQFTEQHLKQTLVPTQLELSYINHIIAEGQEGLMGRLGEYLPDLGWRLGSRFLPPPESLDVHYSFALPDQQGRLHLRVQTGIRNDDQRPVLVLDLTARGCFPSDPSNLGWFDLAHEWIVRGFCDLTGAEVQHTLWRKST